MVWIMPTQNRPEMCQEALDAADRTGFRGPGVVSLDGCRYDGLRVPPGWETKEWPRHVGLTHQLNWFFGASPSERCYGRLDDDMVPVTDGWQERLEEAAGDWCIAYTRDEFVNGTKRTTGQPWMSGAMCIGGDLVRAVGFLSVPGTLHHSMDRVYSVLGERLGLLRYLDDVTVVHRHWVNGSRERDQTDRGQQWGRDQHWIAGWTSTYHEETCHRIQQAMAA